MPVGWNSAVLFTTISQRCFFLIEYLYWVWLDAPSASSVLWICICMPGSGYGFSRGTIILKDWRHLVFFHELDLEGHSQHFLQAFFCLSLDSFSLDMLYIHSEFLWILFAKDLCPWQLCLVCCLGCAVSYGFIIDPKWGLWTSFCFQVSVWTEIVVPDQYAINAVVVVDST